MLVGHGWSLRKPFRFLSARCGPRTCIYWQIGPGALHLSAKGKLRGGLRPLIFLAVAGGRLLGGLRPLVILDVAGGRLLGGLRPLDILGLAWGKLLGGLRPLDILDLAGGKLLGGLRPLLILLSKRGSYLHGLVLIVLPHYGVTRLVTVFLAVKRPLLLQLGIPIP